MNQIEKHLLGKLETFAAFARRRLGDPHLAADVVQESLFKALKGADQLREDESVLAWFYRILRRTIIDLRRRQDVQRRGLEALTQESDGPPEAEEQRVACACLEAIMPTLKPDYAALIQELDLAGHLPGEVASRLGLTANHLRVRHYRARQQLRSRLEEVCRICATHGCLDCTCDPGRASSID